MKKIKYIFVFILTSASLFGQSSSSLELSTQIGNSFRSFSNTENLISNDQIINSKGLHESKSNYWVEMGYNRRFSSHLILKTAINYSKFNYYTTKLQRLRWPSEHDGNGGYEPDPNLPHEITDQVNFSTIGVPILIKYEFTENRFRPFVEIGPSIHFLTNAVYEKSSDLNSESNNISDDFNRINIFARAGVGMSYQLTAKGELFTTVNYRKQLNNLRKSEATENLLDYGLNLGIRIIFNTKAIEIN